MRLSSVGTVFCEPTKSLKAGESFGRTCLGPLHGGKRPHAPCKARRICLTTLDVRGKHHEHSKDGNEDGREFLHPKRVCFRAQVTMNGVDGRKVKRREVKET
jgi:hypothetical protein